MNYYDSVLDYLGNTPLIRLNKIEKANNLTFKLFAKVERFSISGSIKDRPAFYMIKNAFDQGLINKDTTIIEATSGNTGISLALICAYLKLKLVIYMPSSFSKERRIMMEKLGARIILTPSEKGMSYAFEMALKESMTLPNSYLISQFENENNFISHYETTGKEILACLDNQVDVLISPIGTGGTIMGIKKRFLKESINAECIGVEPKESPLLSQNKAGKHNIEGIGANFIPKILSKELIDRIITVSEKEAYSCQDALAGLEGLLCGISSGAALGAALSLDKDKYKDKNVVIILPDNMERYLSKYE